MPLKAILHQEIYKDYTSEDISKYYREKEKLHENIQFVKENEKKTLAQVFTDIRYSKADNEFFSTKLIQVLKDQGFL